MDSSLVIEEDVIPLEVIEEEVFVLPPTSYFSEDTIMSLGELGEVLRRIRKRLLAEGYTICDGKISK